MQVRHSLTERRRCRTGAAGARRRGGFTLIEMVLVTVILATMAAIVFPNLVKIEEARRQRRAEADILRLPTEARLQAARTGSPVTLRFDGDSLVMERISWTVTTQQTPSGSATDVVAAAAQLSMDSGTDQDAQNPQDPENPDQPQELRRVTVDSALQVNTLQRNGDPEDTSTWRWVAYPDGSSDSAAITFQIAGSRKTLWIPAVNPDGSAIGSGQGSASGTGRGGSSKNDDDRIASNAPQWIAGEAPDVTNDVWQAGELAERVTGTGGGQGGG